MFFLPNTLIVFIISIHFSTQKLPFSCYRNIVLREIMPASIIMPNKIKINCIKITKKSMALTVVNLHHRFSSYIITTNLLLLHLPSQKAAGCPDEHFLRFTHHISLIFSQQNHRTNRIPCTDDRLHDL